MPDEQLQSELQTSQKFESLQKSLADEEAKSHHLYEMKRSFVRYVSHEIRSPLNVVMMGLKLLESSVSSMSEKNEPIRVAPVSQEGPGHKRNRRHSVALRSMPSEPRVLEDRTSIVELVRHMLDSSASAASTLNDLLLYEKIEDNLLSIEPTRVHLFDVVGNALDQFHDRASQTGITLSWDLATVESIYTQLDVSKFGQVLKTLISNAIKFTPPNGSVHVSAVCIYNKSSPLPKRTSSHSSRHLTATLLEGLDRLPTVPDSPAPAKPTFYRHLGYKRSSDLLQSIDRFDSNKSDGPYNDTTPRTDTSSMTDLHASRERAIQPSLKLATTPRSGQSMTAQSKMSRLGKETFVRISVDDSGHGISEVTNPFPYMISYHPILIHHIYAGGAGRNVF